MIRACELLPRQDGNRNGWIKKVSIYLSNDGQNWDRPATTTSLDATTEAKTVTLDSASPARFVKLVALEGFDDRPYASLAELRLVTESKR